MNRNVLFGLISIIVLIGIVYFLFGQSSKINSVNSEEVEELLKDENVFILQAHEPYQGELNGTDFILEDWQNIASYQDQLPQDKNAPILVYCRSGRMSADAAQELSDLGYKNIYDLEGGMKAWEASGRRLLFK
jgi:rhodanese-related sulfurtransferase